MAFTKVATVRDVPPGGAKQIVVNGRPIGLYNVGGSFYALEDTCPHRGAALTEGTCEGTEVECPWHGARFDLTSGALLSPPATRGVAAFKVQIVGDEVQVDL